MSLQSFLKTVETKIAAWAGEAETFVETEAEAGFNAVHSVLSALAPSLWADAEKLVVAAAAKLGAGATVDAIGAEFLNGIEADAKTVWTALRPNLFTAVISSLLAAAEAAI